MFTGPAPESAGRRKRSDEAIAVAKGLPVDGWFIWSDAPKVVSGMSKRFTEATSGDKEFLVYKTAVGKVIVKRIR